MKEPSQTASAARLWALIPCAGTGSRAGTDRPKQYQNIAGRPVVMHTLAAFAGVMRLSGTLIVVSPQDLFFETESPPARVVRCGGHSRGHSVFNGLTALRDAGASQDDWVLVHDAARCLITTQQIDALIDACLPDPVGGLLALPLPDTLKSEHSGRVAQTVDRRDKWLAQTPQMFRIAALQNALAGILDTVTDESSAMEFAGLHPLLVKGSAQNFKLTYPEDFSLAQAVLQSRAGQFETE
jgi:2-C-methyl-D-erythritol 4-phosphate cytidylyltransferase